MDVEIFFDKLLCFQKNPQPFYTLAKELYPGKFKVNLTSISSFWGRIMPQFRLYVAF